MKRVFKLLSVLAVCALTATTTSAQTKKYVIDKNIKYQEIDNFSASDAWRMDFVGKNWPM